MNFFDNAWFAWFFTNYSMAIYAIPAIVAFILKAIAIWNPNVPTDKVRDLFKDWPKKEGS